MLDLVLRNAALPVLTALGTILTGLIEGAVVVELIFGRSGIGNLTLESFTSVRAIDHVQVQGFSLVGSITVGKSQVDSNTLSAVNVNGGWYMT